MLPGVCPSCGLKADLEVFAAQAEVRQALAAALRLPAPLGRRALAYLRLFAPEHKSLSMAKAGRLLTELQAAVAAGQVRRHGMDRAAPLALWEHALDLIADRPPDGLPLRDHAYLFQTVWNLAEKAAARQEQAGEDQRRHRLTPASPSVGAARGAEDAAPAEAPTAPSPPAAPPPVRVPMPDAERDALARLLGKMRFPDAAPPPAPAPPPVPADWNPTPNRRAVLAERLRAALEEPHADARPAQDPAPERPGEDPHRQEGTGPG